MQFKSLGTFLALAIVSAALLPAQAAIITKGISGIVTSADANPLDLKIGDILTGSVTFDSGLLTGVGTEFLTLDRDPGLKIHLEIGALHFDETDEEEFPRFPRLAFLDGQILDIGFLVDIASVDLDSEFFIGDEDDSIRAFRFSFPHFSSIVDGDFEFVDLVAVPEPETLALFGFALAGIGTFARRRPA
jgi:hypothetical protein